MWDHQRLFVTDYHWSAEEAKRQCKSTCNVVKMWRSNLLSATLLKQPDQNTEPLPLKLKLKPIEMTKKNPIFLLIFFLQQQQQCESRPQSHVVPVDHRNTRPSFTDPLLRLHTRPLCSSLKRVLLCSLNFTGFRHQLREWSSSLMPEWKWCICSPCTSIIWLFDCCL